VLPLSVEPGKKPDAASSYAVANQWGVYPREVFASAGFAIPYTWRGAEDYELLLRLKGKGKLLIYNRGFAAHPKEGLSIYCKMADRRKYYPYLAGLMKAYLFCARRGPLAYARYFAWYLYHSFFSDLFSDRELRASLRRPFDIRALGAIPPGKSRFFSITLLQGGKGGATAVPGKFLPLASLAVFASASLPGEQVVLSISRAELALRAVFAALLIPLRLLQAACDARSGARAAGSFPFPITPSNADGAARAYADYVGGGEGGK